MATQSEQSLKNYRLEAARICKAEKVDGVDPMTISAVDLRFLAACRAVGYGEISQVTVVNGQPVGVQIVITRIDFTKEP
jgi:hypothetical protein